MKKKLLFLSLTISFLSFHFAQGQCPPTGSSHPTEGEFVQNQWTAYAYNLTPASGGDPDYNQLNYSDYRGYYIDAGYGTNNLSFDSRDSFASADAPSDVTGYAGCVVTDNNHMVSYKRKGFPNGSYNFSIESAPGQDSNNAHDDAVRIFVDGIEVFEHTGCCDTHADVWTGNLGPNSEVEYVWIERPGNSFGALKVEPIQPLSVTYGQNEWYVSVYNDRSFTNLAGHYTRPTLNFNTTTDWGSSNSPSDATGYVGSTVSDNNHSYIYAREGFDCGFYQIDIVRHDDDVELIIDGTSVYQRDVWDNNNPTPNVWQGYLDADSKITFSIIEDAGASAGALDFIKLDNAAPNQVLWTGEVSSDISNPANWCPNLPNTTSNVYIPDATLTNFDPLINISATVASLELDFGAIANLTNSTLEVSDNFINNGTLVDNQINQLILSGATSSIIGKGFEVNTLTSNGSNVSLSLDAGENIRINNVVEVPSGALNTNNQLVLACQLTDLTKRVAQIDDLSNGAIIGNITTEQCIPGRRSFRFLSSSVTTLTSIHDNWQESATAWNDDPNPGYGTHITGSQTDQVNGFDMTTSGNPSLFVYNNATQTWSPIANTNSNTLTAGTPYRLLVRGDRSTDITSNLAPVTPTTLRATGAIFSGNIDLAAGFNASSGSFNFFGNPYPAAIDMSQVMTGATGVQKDYYIWDPNLGGAANSNTTTSPLGGRGGFVTVDLEGAGLGDSNPVGSAANQFLQPGQAAFVRKIISSGPVTVQMPLNESNKNVSVNQTATFSTNPISMIDLTLYKASDFSEGETPRDGLRLKFSDNYTTSPSSEDAAKFGNIDENIAAVNAGKYLAIDRREFPINEEIIPLFLNSYRANQYSLSFSLNEMQAYDIYIVDAYLDEETQITEDGFVFDFSVDANISESVDANRFSLKLQPVTLGLEEVASENFRMYPNPLTDGRLTIDLPQQMQGQFDVKIHNVLGSSVLDLQKEAEGGQIILSNLNLSSGVYFVKIKSENTQTSFTQKLIVE